jgi:hypothetical protein
MSYAASIFNHSCVPNAGVIIDKSTLTFRTLAAISAGAEVCISYLNLTHTEALRRQELQSSYFFLCACPLCGGSDAAKAAARERLRELSCGECEGLIVPLLEERLCVCRNCYKRTDYPS